MRINKTLFICILLICVSALSAQSAHPLLILAKSDVKLIKENYKKYPVFLKSFEESKKIIDDALLNPIEVPVPKDAGGGYTHEKHKQNYNEMYLAGLFYQFTGNEKYASFIKNMLDKYADLYPTLGKHPQGKIETSGRLFWQSLNEAVWLVHTIQAYDCIYNWLKPEDRSKFESKIFFPMVDFFMVDCEEEFDRIHNHGTWTVTAVGMTGLVTGNKDIVQKSLYGTKLDKKGGFLPQLDQLFSPDGYYTEGGYYVRYALWPFFLYAEALANAMPSLKIYDYRDQILKKAFNAALQMTYTNGEFMPINDALKEKTWMSPEIILGLNFVFERYGHDKGLLSLAKEHDLVTLTRGGLEVAKALAQSRTIPEFKWRSVEYCDGPEGKSGGVSILRFGENSDMETLLFKYSSHGLSHGHYDKLHFLFYDQGTEIIQDYGAARFLNIEQKFGGRYLKENKTFALQTIAHNTLVVDEKSNFNSDQSVSEKYHPDKYFFSADDKNFQYTSAKDEYAYPGVKMHRTMAMINDPKLGRPLIVDVFRADSDTEHQYDLPFYYMGHFIGCDFKYEAFSKKKETMGKSNGYQHLWKEGMGKSDSTASITWLNKNRFYSLITNTNPSSEIYFTRIGATDPEFNLRNDPGVIIRNKAKNIVLASVIEPHGEFNPTLEFTKDSYPNIERIEVLLSNDKYTVVQIVGRKQIDWTLLISNEDAEKSSHHSVNVNGRMFDWNGPIAIIKKIN